ncbi:choline kinase-like protein [Sphaerosporella brunnea]|uniref:Choline kinase-like protein n=1 Tax=Sphaerosporella brunnea TaxID=1250544 RepID=A0A5J5EE60_9PEZI|nr:choline kinase-like protein [Sphaerosporella brunnea]
MPHTRPLHSTSACALSLTAVVALYLSPLACSLRYPIFRLTCKQTPPIHRNRRIITTTATAATTTTVARAMSTPDPPSTSPSIKAVSISEYPEEINLPPFESPNGELRAYRPSHILRKSISSKRLQGRLPGGSPRLAAKEQPIDHGSLEDLLGSPAQKPQLTLPQQDGASGRTDSAALILEKCAQWLDAERLRQRLRKERRKARKAAGQEDESSGSADESLDRLEALLTQRPTPPVRSRSHSHSMKSSKRSLKAPPTAPTSDTEYASDGDALVPGCEERLKIPEEIGMDEFKREVLKLAHTLRCKGWRRVSLDRYKEVGISRISGALTNAVYMVTPPEIVPPSISSSSVVNAAENGDAPQSRNRKSPAPLLLRIYGPQVAHLIDRDTELYILRRLARQKIGPRLLGTFENGRFEEFFTARTLTKDDIRVPDTSRHIAKRLKELHEGIHLEPKELKQGPIVWKNWEKWVPRCNEVMRVVDTKREGDPVCGTTWPVFRDAVEKYRRWLVARYGGEEELRKELVFAHNDTQYGNILRLQAAGASPLLLPSNEHRQLVVIDFEYASANTPGFEFANHFCEWMANYHDASQPHVMKTNCYPTDKEMRNFLTAYVEHSLRRRAASTPDAPLDANVPFVGEAERKEVVEKEVERLLGETRAWRAASSAMWCAWGVVQANPNSDTEEEFDYLLYAQQRALLFWGDCISLGVFEPEAVEALQEGLVGRVKMIERESVVR